MAAKKGATKGAPKKPAAKKEAPAKKRAQTRRREEREEVIVERVAAGATGAEAARAAGYSEQSARFEASRVLARPDIQERIERRRKELLAHARVEDDEITGTLAAQMRGFDWADVFPDDPVVERLAAAGASSSAVVKSLKFDKETGRLVSVEAVDSKDAGKVLGGWRGFGAEKSPDDARRDEENRAWAESRLLDLMGRHELTREQAIALVRDRAPTMAKWVTA